MAWSSARSGPASAAAAESRQVGPAGHRLGHVLGRRVRCRRPPPSGRCRSGQGPVAPVDPVVELVARRLQPVGASPSPPHGHLGRHVEQDDQVGPQVVGRPGREPPSSDDRQAPAEALVGEGRADVAVATTCRPARQRRPHHLGHVLGPVGGHQQGLGAVGEARWCGRRAAGTAGRRRWPCRPAPGCGRRRCGRQAGRLGRLAAGLAALEDDEPRPRPPTTRTSWRRPSSPPPSWPPSSWPAAGLLGRRLLGRGLLGRRLLRRPFAPWPGRRRRRACSSSAARSSVRPSTVSPSRSRSEALVSPSVT